MTDTTSEQSKKIYWDAEVARVRQKRILRHISTQRLDAEENAYVAEEQQAVILSRALEEDELGATLSIPDGLLLAKSARNAIYAERKVLYLKTIELQLTLEAVREASEDARYTWLESNRQLTTILSTLHHHKIRTDIYAAQPDLEPISYPSTSLLGGFCTRPPTSPCPSVRSSSPQNSDLGSDTSSHIGSDSNSDVGPHEGSSPSVPVDYVSARDELEV